MPPPGSIANKIAFHQREAQRLHKVSQRLHLRAAVLGQLALAAKNLGHHVRAKRLLTRALARKADAVRARMRALEHRRRIAELKAARTLDNQKRSANTVRRRGR
jgi:hypothetical protein